MRSLLAVLIATALLPSAGRAQAPPPTPPPDSAAYVVVYVDVGSSARSAAVAALKRYRDASRSETGFVRIDVLEQIGRPACFVVVERWADGKALDAHRVASRTKAFIEAMQPLRVSGYDQRPYNTLSVGHLQIPGAQAVVVVSHVDTVTTPGANPPAMLTTFAQASRLDTGNLRFDVLRHAVRANHYTVVEVWQSQQALDAHVAAAHTKQVREALTPMTGSPLDERILKFVE